MGFLSARSVFRRPGSSSSAPYEQPCGFTHSQTHQHIIYFLITQWEKYSAEKIALPPQHFLFFLTLGYSSSSRSPCPPSPSLTCERVWKSLKYLTHITMKKRCIYFSVSEPRSNGKDSFTLAFETVCIKKSWRIERKMKLSRLLFVHRIKELQPVSPFSFSFWSHLAISEMSLVLTHVTIQIQFSVDISNVVHTLKNVFAHTQAELNSLKRETPPVGLITLMPGLRRGAINHIFALG